MSMHNTDNVQQINLLNSLGTQRSLTIKEVVDAVGISRATIYRMMTVFKFPLPVKRSILLVGWRVEDLKTYVELGADGWYEKHGIHQQTEKQAKQA